MAVFLILLLSVISANAENDPQSCVKANKVWFSEASFQACHNFCKNDLAFFPYKSSKDCSETVCRFKGPECIEWTVKTCLDSMSSFASKLKKKVPIPFPDSVFADKCNPIKELCKAMVNVTKVKEDARNTTYQKMAGNCNAVIGLARADQDEVIRRLDFGMSKLLGLVSKLQDAAALFEKMVPHAMEMMVSAGRKAIKQLGKKRRKSLQRNKFDRTKSTKYGQGNYQKNHQWRQWKWNDSNKGGSKTGSATTGSWGSSWGSGNTGSWGSGNTGSWGSKNTGNTGSWGSGNTGSWGSGNTGSWGSKNTGTTGSWGSGNTGSWGSTNKGNTGSWGSGNTGSWGSGNTGSWGSGTKQNQWGSNQWKG